MGGLILTLNKLYKLYKKRTEWWTKQDVEVPYLKKFLHFCTLFQDHFLVKFFLSNKFVGIQIFCTRLSASHQILVTDRNLSIFICNIICLSITLCPNICYHKSSFHVKVMHEILPYTDNSAIVGLGIQYINHFKFRKRNCETYLLFHKMSIRASNRSLTCL